MKKTFLMITLSVFIFVGCGTEKDGTLTLVNNKWIDEFCSLQIEVDENEKEHKIYYKTLYEFTSDDKIYFGSKIYGDKNCTKILKEYPLYKEGNTWVYHDFSETITKKDYTVHKMRVAPPFGLGGEAITIEDIKTGEAIDNQFIVDGLYAINTKRVCFSENLYGLPEYDYTDSSFLLLDERESNITYRKSVSLHIYPDGSKEVGYQNCIVKY